MVQVKAPKKTADPGQVTPKDFHTLAEGVEEDVSEDTSWGIALATQLEKAATKAELQAIWRSSEHLFAVKSETLSSLQVLANKLDERATQRDLQSLSLFVTKEIDRAKTNLLDATLLPAQVLALNAAPAQLLPAPGAGKYLEVIRLEIFVDFATAAYAGTAGKDLSVEYATSGALLALPAAGVLDQVSDQRRCLSHSATHLVGVNEALILKMTAGEVTAGNSPIKVRLDYRIVDVLT